MERLGNYLHTRYWPVPLSSRIIQFGVTEELVTDIISDVVPEKNYENLWKFGSIQFIFSKIF